MSDPASPDPLTAAPPPQQPEQPEPATAADRSSDAWAHVDPDHPRPWDGCIRRGLCCRRSPGWFAPGEAERAAALMGLPMAAFVNRYLILDHHETTIGRIEAFAPVRLAPDGDPVAPPGGRVTEFYHLGEGPCVFFDGQGCRIYGARPLECRLYDCTNLPEDNPRRLDLALLWLGTWKAAQLGLSFAPGPLNTGTDLRAAAARAREIMGEVASEERGDNQ